MNRFEANNFEAKQKEFFDKVDAGEFDDVINARETHVTEQLNEHIRKLERPTTPDELINHAIHKDEFNQILNTPSEPATPEEIDRREKLRESFFNLQQEYREKGPLFVMRKKFKDDTRNLEQYINGKL